MPAPVPVAEVKASIPGSEAKRNNSEGRRGFTCCIGASQTVEEEISTHDCLDTEILVWAVTVRKAFRH